MSSLYNPDDFDRDGMPKKHRTAPRPEPPRFGENPTTSAPQPNGPQWQQSANPQWSTTPAPFSNLGAGQQAYYAAGGMSPVSDRSWIIALLLLVFLGGFGIHNFYMGRMNYGIGQLVLNLAGWGLFFSILGIPVALLSWGLLSVWLLVEFILIVVKGGTDGQGRPMRP